MQCPKGCEGCRFAEYFNGGIKENVRCCWNYKKGMKTVTTYLVQPYMHTKEEGRKLKRYPCIQGYGLYKGGMFIVEEE